MPEWTFLINIGMMFIILGLIFIFIDIINSFKIREISEDRSYFPEGQNEKSVKTGGVILIGPVPVVFGSDKKSALIAMFLAIILMLLAIIFIK